MCDIGKIVGSGILNFVKQKGLAPIIIVLLIAAAIGGYLVYTGKITLPQQTTQTSVDETANWKTYKGDNFSFQYPTDWNIKSDNNVIFLEKEHYFDNWEGTSQTLKSTIKISHKAVTSELSLDDWLKQLYQRGDDNLFALVTKYAEKTKLDGKDALHVTIPGSAGMVDEGTIAIYKGNGYDISIQGQVAFPNIREVYNQILSTFKFTD